MKKEIDIKAFRNKGHTFIHVNKNNIFSNFSSHTSVTLKGMDSIFKTLLQHNSLRQQLTFLPCYTVKIENCLLLWMVFGKESVRHLFKQMQYCLLVCTCY